MPYGKFANNTMTDKKRTARQVSERELALALVLELAETPRHRFALLGFYDDDADFLQALANRVQVEWDKAFHNKITRVSRRLVNYGVLYSEMRGTYKEYIGEPSKQMEYWLLPGKANLLTRGQTDYTMSPEGEASFLLRHAYPAPEAG
jgi:hypothetical protein